MKPTAYIPAGCMLHIPPTSAIMRDLILPQTQLRFGAIKMVNASLVEVIINPNVEVTLPMMLRCEEVLTDLMHGNYGLLWNEMHPHTYAPEAKAYLTQMNNIKVIAMVMSTRFNDIAIKMLQSFQEEDSAHMKVFYNREKALEWLESRVG